MEYWFEAPSSPYNSMTVWYWDGRKAWHTTRNHRDLKASEFTPAGMIEAGYVIIPDPFTDPALLLPEGL